MSSSQITRSVDPDWPDYTYIDTPEFWNWQKAVDKAFRQALVDFRGMHWQDYDAAQAFVVEENGYSNFHFDYASSFLSGENPEIVALEILEKLDTEGWCP